MPETESTNVPSPDYGNLYKFIASAGLLLIVAAIVAPWVMTQSLATFLIPEQDLHNLTTVAEDALRSRQRGLSTTQDQIIGLAFIVMVLGAAMLMWAVKEWYQYQLNINQREKNETAKSSPSYETVSAEEKEASDDQDSGELPIPDDPQPVIPPPPVEPSPETRTAPAGQSALASMRQETRKLEERLQSLLQDGYGHRFTVADDVKLTTGRSMGATFDALLDPEEGTGWGQLGVELKLGSTMMFKYRLFDFIMGMSISTQDLSLGRVYTAKQGKPRPARTTGLLLLILRTGEHYSDGVAQTLHGKAEAANSSLKREIGVLIIPENRFEELSPQSLREAIATVWAGGPNAVLSLS